eukprot:scaffold271793_cov30-Tisochrysis_lutea.AAC.3
MSSLTSFRELFGSRYEVLEVGGHPRVHATGGCAALIWGLGSKVVFPASYSSVHRLRSFWRYCYMPLVLCAVHGYQETF